MIDPEYWSDEEIGRWSFAARLFYIGLWNFADDCGRFKAPEDLLKSQIFPYDHRINIAKLKIELGAKIQWYEENGSKYGYIVNFLKYQRIDRPSESKLPEPPQFDESSSNTYRRLVPNISKDNISKYKLSRVGAVGEDKFEEIWLRYPIRQGKKEALRHFRATVKTAEDLVWIHVALDNYLQSGNVKRRIIQNGSTWFNRWEDWVSPSEEMIRGNAGNEDKRESLPQWKCELCGQTMDWQYKDGHNNYGCPKQTKGER